MKFIYFLIVLFASCLSFAEATTESSCEFSLFYSPGLCVYEIWKDADINLNIQFDDTGIRFTHKPSPEEVEDHINFGIKLTEQISALPINPL